MNYSTMRRIGAPALVVVASLAFALPAVAAVRPDDRSGLRGVGVASASPVPPDDRAGFRGTDLLTLAPTVATLHPDNGFDWAAAGAGAGSATALMLLLTGAALILRRNYRRAGTPA